MMEFLRKLKSRKFILAVAGIVYGIALAMGADSSEIESVAGAVATLASVVTYIIVEGKVDAESVKNAIVEVDGAMDVIGFKDEGTDSE